MKKVSIMKRLLFAASVAAILALAAPLASHAQDKGSAKGGAGLLLKPIKTTQDIEALQPGDAVVMSCPKCKTMTVHYVEATRGQIKDDKVKQEHLCPGCETKIETKGTGKAAKNAVTHVCKKCGSEDVMCCILKKGGGHTKGMDEEKK